MLQEAYARIAPIIPAERVLVITNARYVDLVSEQAPAIPAPTSLASGPGAEQRPRLAWLLRSCVSNLPRRGNGHSHGRPFDCT